MVGLIDGIPYIILTVLLLAASLRVHGLLPYPSGLIVVLLHSQLMITLVASNVVEYDFLYHFTIGGLYLHFGDTMLFSVVLSLAVVLSPGLTARPGLSSASSLFDIRGDGLPASYLNILTSVCLLLSVAYILFTDWAFNYLHIGYLSGAVSVSTDGPLVSLPFAIQRTLTVVFLLSAPLVCLGIALARNAPAGAKMVLWFYVSMVFIVGLGNSSRSAALIPGTLAIGYFVAGGRAATAKAVLCGVVTLYTILYALYGRGQELQGFSTVLGHTATMITDELGASLSGVGLNLAEGIFVVAESLADDRPFELDYALLSVSPVPSIIDQFDTIRVARENRLSPFVPMSGFVEIMKFGLPQMLWVFVAVLGAVRICFSFRSRNALLFLLTNFLLFFSLYNGLTYQARGFLKYIWFIYYIYIIYLGYAMLTSSRSNRSTARQDYGL